MPRNLYKVSKCQWRKWTILARMVFNKQYWTLLNNQSILAHPKTTKISKPEWKTQAWNSAWLAADATDESLKELARA